jgi:hypothetical protein
MRSSPCKRQRNTWVWAWSEAQGAAEMTFMEFVVAVKWPLVVLIALILIRIGMGREPQR